MSIRTKLLVAFALLSTAGLFAALLAARGAVERAAKDKMELDLRETVRHFQRQLQAEREALAFATNASFTHKELVDTYGLANAQDDALGLGSPDGDGEAAAIEEAHKVLASSDLPLLKEPRNALLVYVNTAGKLLYSLADSRKHGVGLREVPLVQHALEGRTGWDLLSLEQVRRLEASSGVRMVDLRLKDDLVGIYAAPVVRGRQLIGAILVGRLVKPLLLPALEEMADARIVLKAADGTAVSTLDGASSIPEAAWSATTGEVELGGRRHLAIARWVEREQGGVMVQALLLREVDKEVAPILERFTRELPWIAGVALAGSVVLALYLARRLSRPLIDLEQAARKVKLGDLTVEVKVDSADEVGRLAASFNEMVLGLRQRDQIKGLFKQYLDPRVVEELIRHPEKASPGGERRVVTVLFSDLVGFTSISEQLGPEALVAALNEYFEAASHELAVHGATFDKFIGDAIMCFWNAPLPQEDHAARACLTALALLRVVNRLAGSSSLGLRGKSFDCRIGINTGPCVVGNIGSQATQDYTVIGDTVNLASRLESAAKIYGTRTLVSEHTVAAARGVVITRELDLLRVRGRAQPVRVYELLGLADAPVPPHAAQYANGLALYRERRFDEALAVFEQSPDDAPSRVMAERCRAFRVQPPPMDWSGVHEVHG